MTGRRDQEKKMMERCWNEMTPARLSYLDQAFQQMKTTSEAFQPAMQQMHFGGEYNFDANRRQVELNGEFSKVDLMRIAMTMID